jgi:hypothetical protein
LPNKEVKTRTRFVAVILALIGLVLILTSFIIGSQHDFWQSLCRELGIVVLSVFTVSLIYEILMAERHLQSFSLRLRSEIEQTQKNAAACVELGILQIFATRDLFETEYPLSSTLARLPARGSARFIARSLYYIMNKTEFLQQALQRGARVDLCLLDPDASDADLAKIPDLVIDEVKAAVEVFKRQLGEWLASTRPPGQLELRFHNEPMPESFTWYASTDFNMGVWDLELWARHQKQAHFRRGSVSQLRRGPTKRGSMEYLLAPFRSFCNEYGEVKINKLTSSTTGSTSKGQGVGRP